MVYKYIIALAFVFCVIFVKVAVLLAHKRLTAADPCIKEKQKTEAQKIIVHSEKTVFI